MSTRVVLGICSRLWVIFSERNSWYWHQTEMFRVYLERSFHQFMGFDTFKIWFHYFTQLWKNVGFCYIWCNYFLRFNFSIYCLPYSHSCFVLGRFRRSSAESYSMGIDDDLFLGWSQFKGAVFFVGAANGLSYSVGPPSSKMVYKPHQPQL